MNEPEEQAMKQYTVFRCRCNEFICRCDQYGEQVYADNACHAACLYPPGDRGEPVVVQASSGDRWTVAFDDDKPFIT